MVLLAVIHLHTSCRTKLFKDFVSASKFKWSFNNNETLKITTKCFCYYNSFTPNFTSFQISLTKPELQQYPDISSGNLSPYINYPNIFPLKPCPPADALCST